MRLFRPQPELPDKFLAARRAFLDELRELLGRVEDGLDAPGPR